MGELSRRTFLGRTAAALIATASSSTLDASSSPGTVHHVEIRSFRFLPSRLVVRPGDSVVFVNRDIAPHTATALDGSWGTGELKLNESASVRVTDGMATEYLCRFHPLMTGEIAIQTRKRADA